MDHKFAIGKDNFDLLSEKAKDGFKLLLDKEQFSVSDLFIAGNELQLKINGEKKTAFISKSDSIYEVCIDGITFSIKDLDDEEATDFASSGGTGSDEVTAPMPGKVIKVLVKEGQEVKAGDKIAILEAMKMENELTSPKDGTISKILFKENDLVEAGAKIVEFD